MNTWFRLFLLAAGALALAATECNPSGPDSVEDTVLWSVNRFVNTNRAVLTDTSVIVADRDEGSLVSLDRSTGTTLWETKLDALGAFFGRVLVRQQNLVYAAPFDLYAVDIATGQIKWIHRSNGGTHITRYPVLADGSLFVATARGEVLRIVPETGTIEWEVDLEEAAFPVTVSNGLVLVPTRSFASLAERDGPLGAGRVVALSAADGSLVWEVSVPDSAGFPGSGGVSAPPVVVNSVVVVGTWSSRVLGLRLRDGARLWEYAEGSPVFTNYSRRGVSVGGLAVMFKSIGVLEAFDPLTGQLMWQLRPRLSGTTETSEPAESGQRVYGIMAASLWILDSDGSVVWRFGARKDGDGLPQFIAGPTVAPDGTIYADWINQKQNNQSFFGAIRPPDSVR